MHLRMGNLMHEEAAVARDGDRLQVPAALRWRRRRAALAAALTVPLPAHAAAS
jgi:hypothetical protein